MMNNQMYYQQNQCDYCSSGKVVASFYVCSELCDFR